MTTGTVNIVGGGIAGLLAAVELAREGVQVALFEKAAEPGGRARTRNVQGFLLNQGPHALYRNGAFKRELDRLGIPYSGGRSLAGGRKAIWRGKLYELPVVDQFTHPHEVVWHSRKNFIHALAQVRDQRRDR